MIRADQEPIIVFFDNDDQIIRRTVDSLRLDFKKTHVFSNEKDFFDFITTTEPDVIFLHLDVRPNDGIILLKEIMFRNSRWKPSVIIYSDNEDDFVQELAFVSGADAFINFHKRPLVTKLFVKNLLKRKRKFAAGTRKKLEMDIESHLIYKSGRAVQLPRKEFKLFELLFNAEDFLTKAEIAARIWKDESIAGKRTIDVHIYNIRQFLGKDIIQSKKGGGYRINKKKLN